MADPLLVIHDKELVAIVKAAAKASGLLSLRGILHAIKAAVQALWKRQSVFERAKGLVDPNDWRNVSRTQEGLALIPIATRNGQRNGTREHIREVAAAGYPLTVALRALASRVLLDDSNAAYGVEYLEGQSLYRADPRAAPAAVGAAPAAVGAAQAAVGAAASGAPGTPKVAYARREVILAGGAFNTPQLLMLSGIGPEDELRRHRIPVRVALPGVGRNLQDRYEVGVISDLKQDFSSLAQATFDPVRGDPLLDQWKATKTGLYSSNGAILGIIMKSKPERKKPDLFVFGLPGYFKGYFPGYAEYFLHDGDPSTPAAAHGEELLRTRKSRFTWAILKAHTNNTAGFVRLRSTDPRDTPEINFKYFEEGNDATEEDLDSVVEGVKFVRRMSQAVGMFTKSELLPGKALDDDQELRTWIKNEAWGHHACGTCKIGPEGDPTAVLDSRFRVRGARRLRVVDASVFPRIPGFFIVTPIYMIAEKASDVILEDAARPSAMIATVGAEAAAPVAAAGGAGATRSG